MLNLNRSVDWYTMTNNKGSALNRIYIVLRGLGLVNMRTISHIVEPLELLLNSTGDKIKLNI